MAMSSADGLGLKGLLRKKHGKEGLSREGGSIKSRAGNLQNNSKAASLAVMGSKLRERHKFECLVLSVWTPVPGERGGGRQNEFLGNQKSSS